MYNVDYYTTPRSSVICGRTCEFVAPRHCRARAPPIPQRPLVSQALCFPTFNRPLQRTFTMASSTIGNFTGPTALNKSVPFPTDFDYTKQGVPVPGTKRPGQTGANSRSLWPLETDHVSQRTTSMVRPPHASQRYADRIVGRFGQFDLTTPHHLRTQTEVFEVGLAHGRDRPMLGHRPVISTNPLTFAKHYVWETYGDIDVRRRALGSALDKLFREGVLGGGEYETVGLWSQNRPGECCA